MSIVTELTNEEKLQDLSTSNDVALDLYFKIHDKVNARSEEISKSYKENILVKFEDVRELHNKILQSIKSLHPARNNLGIRISVSHNEGESEKFNSFEEFEKHNVTSPNPTSNIMMRYVFTLFDAETKQFETYKVTGVIGSRVAQLKEIEKEAPSFISGAIISSMVTTTAKITIQYEDYVKARHFTAMFDEWVKGCEVSNNVDFINTLKKFTHLIPRVGKLLVYVLLAMFTANAIDIHLITNDLSVKFIVVYASVFVVVGGLAETFLRKIETSIDSYLALSYLCINKGDAKLIKEYSDRNKSSIVWASISFACTLGLGVFTNSVYDLIKWFITS